MRRPNTLGVLTTLGIFGLTALAIAFLPINGNQGLLLGILGFFLGCLAGLGVATDLARRNAGIDYNIDGARVARPELSNQQPLGPAPDHIAANASFFDQP